MQPLHKTVNLLYAALRWIWHLLPYSWRCGVRRYWNRRPLLGRLLVMPHTLAGMAWRRTPYSWRRGVTRVIHRDPPGQTCRQIKQSLRQRLGAGPGPSVMFLPLTSWYTYGFQRPHQMARALAAEGCPVIFCEPWTTDPDHQAQLRLIPDAERNRQFVGLREVAERLHLMRVPDWLLSGCLVETPPDCLVMLWPYQARLIPRESSSLVEYEMVDDHELLPTAAWWRSTHRKWLLAADVVAATAESLAEKLRAVRDDVLMLPNGVSIPDWRIAANTSVPPDMRGPRQAPVVVAYYGALGGWFDWDLWEAAAVARPDWAFVLVGFPFGIDEQDLAARLDRRANLHYLGPKEHGDLPRYMAHVDVAAIPFQLNEITHACSPLKLFEYMAAGKPVVATPMREILKYQSVLFAEGAQAFVEQLEEAVQKRTDTQYLALLKSEAEANSWQIRAQALRRAIESARARQNGVARRNLRSPDGGTVQ